MTDITWSAQYLSPRLFQIDWSASSLNVFRVFVCAAFIAFQSLFSVWFLVFQSIRNDDPCNHYLSCSAHAKYRNAFLLFWAGSVLNLCAPPVSFLLYIIVFHHGKVFVFSFFPFVQYSDLFALVWTMSPGPFPDLISFGEIPGGSLIGFAVGRSFCRKSPWTLRLSCPPSRDLRIGAYLRWCG